MSLHLRLDDIHDESFRGVVEQGGGVEALRLPHLQLLLLLLAEFIEMSNDLVFQTLIPCPCGRRRAGARDGDEIGPKVEGVDCRDGEQGGGNLRKGRRQVKERRSCGNSAPWQQHHPSAAAERAPWSARRQSIR